MKIAKLALITLSLITASFMFLSGCSDTSQQEETKNPPQVRKNKKDN